MMYRLPVRSTRNSHSGFTLVELMIAVAVLAIAVAIAIPNFSTQIKNSQIRSTNTDLITVLKFARTESIRRGDTVIVSPISASTTSDQWGSGIRVWHDADNDNVMDATEELRNVIISEANLDLTVTNGPSIRFNARGESTLSNNLTVNICDDRTGETGRQIHVLQSGLISLNNSLTCS